MVKIFLDTADIAEIREAVSWGVLDGVTTNPTLVSKTGRKWGEVVQDILAVVDGPVNLEVTSEDAPSMVSEGRRLAKLHKNVVVKVQMTTEGLKAIKALSAEGIKVNTTLIFSANQAILYEWDCEVLVASIRHPLHVIDAAKIGAHIVTMPFEVLQKMTKHALTDVGLKRFLEDWKKVPK